MGNTQRIWILYVIVLSLNCLMAREGAIAAKRHLIINAAGLIQPTYFEKALTSKFKSKDMLLWRSFLFFPRKWEAMDSLWVKKNRVWLWKTPWNISDYRRWSRWFKILEHHCCNFLWVLHPEQLQDCWLRRSHKIPMRVPIRLPVPPIRSSLENYPHIPIKMDYGCLSLFSVLITSCYGQWSGKKS